jgi:hypothetical protein
VQFYSNDECEEWLRARQRIKPDEMPQRRVERISFPLQSYRIFSFAHWIATSLTHRRPTLFWITEWGIWPSSENWHLYYALRNRYGDSRLLQESPGHLFLGYEAEDLASFLQLVMLSGWGGYILTQANHVNAFLSHDEWVDFFAESPERLFEIRDSLDPWRTNDVATGASLRTTTK